MNIDNIIEWFIHTYTHPWVIVWLWIELFFIIFIVFLFKKFPKSGIILFFDLIYEKVYDFFEELLWKKEKFWVKTFVTVLFFIILLSNLWWVLAEFFVPIFWHEMEHFVKIPTTDINFNVAMAVIWVLVILYEQLKFLWFGKFIYEYFPIFGKNYIPYNKGKLPKIVDFPLFLLVKSFDIIISLFLWLLEIVWLLAKIISLSFRLFWNMTSGWVLLTMLFTALSWFTISLVWIDMPIVMPLIVYVQEILVALIQAFVFPLLIAIFIKVAKLH